MNNSVNIEKQNRNFHLKIAVFYVLNLMIFSRERFHLFQMILKFQLRNPTIQTTFH